MLLGISSSNYCYVFNLHPPSPSSCERRFKPHQCPSFKELSMFQVLKTFNTSKIVLTWLPCSGPRQALLCSVAKYCLFLKEQVSQGQTTLPSDVIGQRRLCSKQGGVWGPDIWLESCLIPTVFFCMKKPNTSK